jgi:Cu2+-exporting ATPase
MAPGEMTRRHALGLAIPLVIAISTSLGARNGLLVKDRIALERARQLDTVIFDTTGTLTKGEPVLAAVSGADETELLRLAASVEAGGRGDREELVDDHRRPRAHDCEGAVRAEVSI